MQFLHSSFLIPAGQSGQALRGGHRERRASGLGFLPVDMVPGTIFYGARNMVPGTILGTVLPGLFNLHLPAARIGMDGQQTVYLVRLDCFQFTAPDSQNDLTV